MKDIVSVVIIEDESVQGMAIEAMFKTAPCYEYEVDWVKTYGDAKILASMHRTSGKKIEVVVLDLILPNGNGVQLVKAVKALWPDAILIVWTQIDDDASARTAIEQDAYQYLVKDRFGCRAVLDVVRNSVQRRKQRQVVEPLQSLVQEKGPQILEQWRRDPNMPPNVSERDAVKKVS